MTLHESIHCQLEYSWFSSFVCIYIKPSFKIILELSKNSKHSFKLKHRHYLILLKSAATQSLPQINTRQSIKCFTFKCNKCNVKVCLYSVYVCLIVQCACVMCTMCVMCVCCARLIAHCACVHCILMCRVCMICGTCVLCEYVCYRLCSVCVWVCGLIR